MESDGTIVGKREGEREGGRGREPEERVN